MAKTNEQDDLALARAPDTKALDFGGLTDLLGFHVLMANIAMLKDWMSALERFGVTRKQYTVLYLIGRNPGCSQVSLGAAMSNDRATMMALVARLEGRGLISRVRSLEDGRRQALNLTEAGAQLLREADAETAAHEAKFRAAFTDQAYADLVASLRRLARVVPDLVRD